MKVISYVLLFSVLQLFAGAGTLSAQGEIDEEKKVFFRNEKTYGLNLNSNGWGADYRYGKRINARSKWLFEGGFNYIKHEKERKEFNYYSTSFGRFVYGKNNVAVNLRVGAGRQREIIEKFDKNSISIRFVWTVGASAVFLKPIYYKILKGEQFVIMKYEDAVHAVPFFYILERAPFFKGMSETRVIPGGYAKAGFSFEFSKTDKKLSILETGLFAEAYPQPVEIMANEMNHYILYGIYFSYRFGKVVSGYHIEE